INGIVAGDAGTYTAKLTGATCGAPEKSGTLTVNPVPEANAGTAPEAQCFDLAGNTFSLNGSGSNGTPSWAVAPGGNPGSFAVDITGGNTYTPSVKVTSGTSGGSVTLRLTVTSDQTPSCGNKTSDVTVTILPQAAGPQVTYIAPTCLESTFKVTVDNPVSGSTYTLRQLAGGVSPMTKKAPDDVVGGKITFEGLTPGKGYRITETNSAGCISAPNSCGDFSGVTGATVNAGKQPTITEQEITLNGLPRTNVLAAPNPFNDRIRFTLKSAVSGQGSLELFNMLGQKVKTVFRGYVNANEPQTIEYAVPYSQRSSMIYLFRVGAEHTSGKLIGLR
ncbi:MAG TPA: hypothetical protein VFL47_03100, partial [Flavisolibacter sp.]|nr:hypothetical protein [Flavisolibacter sp.]